MLSATTRVAYCPDHRLWSRQLHRQRQRQLVRGLTWRASWSVSIREAAATVETIGGCGVGAESGHRFSGGAEDEPAPGAGALSLRPGRIIRAYAPPAEPRLCWPARRPRAPSSAPPLLMGAAAPRPSLPLCSSSLFAEAARLSLALHPKVQPHSQQNCTPKKAKHSFSDQQGFTAFFFLHFRLTRNASESAGTPGPTATRRLERQRGMCESPPSPPPPSKPTTTPTPTPPSTRREKVARRIAPDR